MSTMTPPWYVLTGGPCAGKTTTINALSARGYPIVKEGARGYIEGELAKGRTIEDIRGADNSFFYHVLRAVVAAESVIPQDTEYFLDRAIPDSLAYYRAFGVPEDDELLNACRLFRYKKVFLLEPLDFEPDEARNESPELAEKLHASIRQAYEDLGYQITTIPILPVEDRVDLILRSL